LSALSEDGTDSTSYVLQKILTTPIPSKAYIAVPKNIGILLGLAINGLAEMEGRP